MPLFFFLRKKERQKTIFFLFFAIAQPINCLGSNTLARFYSHALPVARLLLNKKNCNAEELLPLRYRFLLT